MLSPQSVVRVRTVRIEWNRVANEKMEAQDHVRLPPLPHTRDPYRSR